LTCAVVATAPNLVLELNPEESWPFTTSFKSDIHTSRTLQIFIAKDIFFILKVLSFSLG
jgi:hypothetical protein